jgi:AraC family transcriptional regulator of adaptative response/methylated-DNA-[protein]-cysteine methyltransferase
MDTASKAWRQRLSDFERVERAIRYIERHLPEQPSLVEISAAAGLAPHHFARTFRRWAGISPKQFVQRLTVNAAEQSLAAGAPVLDAALRAGLSGPGRLHDLCVTLNAVTPGEFKCRGGGVTFRHGSFETPFGAATAVTSERGISFLGFKHDDGTIPGWREFREHWSAAEFKEDPPSVERLGRMIFGAMPRRGDALRLWVHGTNFQTQVWQALLDTARDSTVSYADIAREIGAPQAARAVGSAVGANPVAWLIPCHHVLRANGALGGYRWGLERKRAMLAWEYSRAVASGDR